MELSTCLKHDFKAFTLAIEGEETELATIYANRFLSDVLLEGDYRYSVIGFAMRDMALDLARIEQHNPADSRSLREAMRDVMSVHEPEIGKSTPNVLLLWQPYCEYVKRTHKLFMSELEKKTYSEAPELTAKVVDKVFTQFLLA